MKARSCFLYLGLFVVILFLSAGVTVWAVWLYPLWGIPFSSSRHTQVPLTPPWALECWLWEDDVNTETRVLELLEGYRKYDLPVRTVLIDSPWSTRYNDFEVDETRYPNPGRFFRELEDQGYRVVLWMTSMVDSWNKDTLIRDSTDWFEDARAKGYLAGEGAEIKWWKGKGGFIDYTNPDAARWWKDLQKTVLDWGIDGWKLDGTATLFSSRKGFLLFPFMKTHSGWTTTRRYMDLYYRTEYSHGLEHNPEFITLSRSVDGFWTHPEGFAPFDAAPVTWVGDQDHTWTAEEEGLEEAIRYILRAAKLGYCVIGSDVGGYGGSVIPSELYIRWAEFSAFCGLFLNGGHGERALWNRSMWELRQIRKFSWLHTELVPYIYHHVASCHHGGFPLMRPIAGRYQYLFGDSLLVAPIYRNSMIRTVELPPGKWRYFFDDRELIQGPQTLRREFPIDEFPVYVRSGSVIPLDVQRSYSGFGDQDSKKYRTWLVYPDESVHKIFRLPETTDPVEVTVTPSKGELQITIEGDTKPPLLRIHADFEPKRVSTGGSPLSSGSEWSYQQDKRVVWIHGVDSGPNQFKITF